MSNNEEILITLVNYVTLLIYKFEWCLIVLRVCILYILMLNVLASKMCFSAHDERFEEALYCDKEEFNIYLSFDVFKCFVKKFTCVSMVFS